jgi:hypothetical protein
MSRPWFRITIADLMGLVAAAALGFAWPVLVVPLIGVGLSLALGIRSRHLGVALALVSASLYGPFSWLLLVGNCTEPYRRQWLNLWPILPGLVPGALGFHPHGWIEFPVMGLVTLGLLIGLTWLGCRGGTRLAFAVGTALIVSVPSAWIAYALFRF